MSNRSIPRSKAVSFLLSQSGFLLAFIVVLSIAITLANRNFIKPQNIINVLGQISMVGIVAVGVGLVLISGDFDISVGSQISLNGAVLAILLTRTGSVPLAVGAVILLGAGLGAVNGLIVSKSKCASFIMTLGTRAAYHGLRAGADPGAELPAAQGTFETLGRGELFGVIPVPILVFFLVLLFAFLLMRYTRFGRTLFAVGGQPQGRLPFGGEQRRDQDRGVHPVRPPGGAGLDDPDLQAGRLLPQHGRRLRDGFPGGDRGRAAPPWRGARARRWACFWGWSSSG